jgi:hypothetical protein
MSKKQMFDIYSEINDILRKAQIYVPDSYYPLDIWAWTSLNLLGKEITEEEKQDIYANVISVFDKAELDNPSITGIEEYNDRRVQLGDYVNDLKVSETSFQKLLDMGSASGIFIRAKNKLSSININKPLIQEEVSICKDVIQFLKDYSDYTSKDMKCLYLLLKLIWATNTNEPLFYKEKRALKFDDLVWREIQSICERIMALSNGIVGAWVKYIKAISLFHLGNMLECYNIFEEIRSLYYLGERRIILSYIASNSDGSARKYSGQLRSLEDNKARIFINEIRKEVPYFNRDFIMQNPPLREPYDNIELGFNFLGVQVSKINSDWGRK